MFYKNFKYFMEILKSKGLTQKQALEEIGFSEGVAWQWKARQTPSRNSLRLMARYFSEQLNIPYSEFDNGQALLTKDFEKILAKHKGIGYIDEAQPTHQGTPGRGETRIAKQEMTRRQALDNFEKRLDYLYNRYHLRIEETSLHRPIPASAMNDILDRIIEFLISIEYDPNFVSSLSEKFKRLRRLAKNVDSKSNAEGKD